MGAQAETTRRAETILVVEDDPVVLKIVGRALERLGFRVLTALSGDEALERMATVGRDIGLLLTDTVLPDRDSDEVVREFERRYPHAPVLYMSGYAKSEQSELALRARRKGRFLAKPFTPGDLELKVRAALDEALSRGPA